jgi:hypothetical protein
MAGEGMGKYQGTRWPLEGTFTHIESQRRLVYDARSWTEGEQDTTTIDDPAGLFNSSLGGSTRRAIDLRAGDELDEDAFTGLVVAAVARNASRT